MIINARALLAILIAVLEIGAGVALIAAAGRGLRSIHRGPDGAASAEAYRHLLLLLVLLLGGLVFVSLLLWALLLSSYVPQWEGLRCVTGVFKIGSGHPGLPGWLPVLARTVTGLQLALLFGAGAGLVLHFAGRDRPEGAPRRRHLAALLAVGLIALLVASVEIAWIVIPKDSPFLAAGCCTTTAGPALEAGRAPLERGAEHGLAALYAFPALLTSAVFAAGARREAGRVAIRHLLRIVGSGIVLFTGLRYVSDVVAPERLGLPLHRCIPCLLELAPETMLGIALLAVPLLASGWTATMRFLGGGDGPFTDRVERNLDRLALFALLGALAFFASLRSIS